MSLPPFVPPGGSFLGVVGRKHPAEAYEQAWELLEASAPQKALQILEPAVEDEPEAMSLRTLRAWAYFLTAQLAKAEADLVTLVEVNPTDLWARFALGRVLERQSRFGEALAHMRLAAIMSGDVEHQTAVLRCERKLAVARGDAVADPD